MSQIEAAASVLSVVIPAYNEEDGIGECVERVLAVRPALSELGLDLEVIVVDDGSGDRTAEIVRGYAASDKGVRLVCHNPNRGYGAALKTGFAAGCGDLLAFLDADGTYPAGLAARPLSRGAERRRCRRRLQALGGCEAGCRWCAKWATSCGPTWSRP